MPEEKQKPDRLLRDQSWGAYSQRAERGPLAFGVKIVCLLCALSIVIGGASWGLGLIGQGGKIIQKTLDADNVIHNYEWFKSTAEALEACPQKIQIAERELKEHQEFAGPRADWTFEDKQEASRLRTVLSGQKQRFENMKADFRARSKMANRAIFKDDALIMRWVDALAGVDQ